MKIAITGGHHSSALPVISKLKEMDPQVQLVWFGHKYSLKGDKNPTLEYREIIDLNIEFINLHAGKVYKTFDIGRLLKVPYGFFEALYYLIKHKPTVILSFGGYLAVPVVLAGWFLGIPSVTHEQTLVAGYANKVISRFAKKILISWEQSAKYFPQEKVVFTGLPLRKEIFEVSTNNFDPNTTLPTIYITAGKTGSHKINKIIGEGLDQLLQICNVIHQCGDNSVFNDFENLTSLYSKLDPKPLGKYYIRKFILKDEIGEVFRKADLIVSRSGAHIISEILALGKSALLIPIPWVSHNEQLINAQFLQQKGLAAIIEEKDLSKDLLINKIKEMISVTTSLVSKKVELDNAAELIAHEIIKFQKK